MRKNNFDFLRLLFASFVIITHSFVLLGLESFEPLSNLTQGQINFSFIGLRGFFIISGFLIYKSLESSFNMQDYIWKRVLRVFPALIFLGIITSFLIAPLLSKVSFVEYFSNKNIYLFLITSVSLFIKNDIKCLPGLFINNPYNCEVNGSLWTITYEFCFYLLLLILLLFPKNNIRKLLLLLALLGIYLFKILYVEKYFKYEYYIKFTSIGMKSASDFGCYFIIGSLLAIFKYDSISPKWHKYILVFCSIIFILLILLNLFKFFPIVLIPILLSIGLLKFNIFGFLEKIGDISYGTYLYGFLVQQIIISLFNLNIYLLIILTLLISWILGFLSWNYLEKPCLVYKNIFSLKTSKIIIKY